MNSNLGRICCYTVIRCYIVCCGSIINVRNKIDWTVFKITHHLNFVLLMFGKLVVYEHIQLYCTPKIVCPFSDLFQVLYIICSSANVIYLKESPFAIFDLKSSFVREASRNANTHM